jgi:hypothetical protein
MNDFTVLLERTKYRLVDIGLGLDLPVARNGCCVAVKGSRVTLARAAGKLLELCTQHTTYVYYTFLYPQRPAWLLGTGQPLSYGQRSPLFFILVTRLLLIRNMP